MVQASVTLDYTTILNIIFLALAGVFVYRFVRTGGVPPLRSMHMPMRSRDAGGGDAPRSAAGH